MLSVTQTDTPNRTTLARRQLLDSLKDPEYRAAFVEERVKASIALQIRALREQRNKMTQKQLGTAIGMAQTWVSKLESPEYGKMTVATLLRLATSAFDTDLEIKFRPFSETLGTLPGQGPEYFRVASFQDELPELESAQAEGQYHGTATITGNALLDPQLFTQQTINVGEWLSSAQAPGNFLTASRRDIEVENRQQPGETDPVASSLAPIIPIDTARDSVRSKHRQRQRARSAGGRRLRYA